MSCYVADAMSAQVLYNASWCLWCSLGEWSGCQLRLSRLRRHDSVRTNVGGLSQAEHQQGKRGNGEQVSRDVHGW